MTRYRAASANVNGYVDLPVIIDTETQEYVGFINHFGNADLAARFEGDRVARDRFTWRPLPEGTPITERPTLGQKECTHD